MAQSPGQVHLAVSGLGLHGYWIASFDDSLQHFCASTLRFIGQLALVSDEVRAAEQIGIRHLLPGPGNWLCQSDPFHLKGSFGQVASFRNITLVAEASYAESQI